MTERYADAVVVAAGASRRMDGVDKLAADLGGRPLLARSVEAMASAASVRRVIVVTAAERVAALSAAPWVRDFDAQVVTGGAQRSDSVLAGVRATTAEVVLVHDGARPLASAALVDAVAAAAAEHGAAVPVVPVADALKRIDGGGRIDGAVDRAGLVRAQTPQAARRQLLLDAFDAARGRPFPDEAALLEAAGLAVATVPGEAVNVKVTEPGDLELVRRLFIAAAGSPEVRLGHGSDSHPFGPDDGLWLAGVELPDAPRLYGHSDGDVALHALATAILAASGRGDLGRLFPPTDPSTAGAPSAGLLEAVIAEAAGAGWRPATAQVALTGARPRLGSARLDQMRTRVADLLHLPREVVAVTASTGNLSGPEGAGRVISATALVTMGPVSGAELRAGGR